jgi:F0F1-type ATP synthase assembly protein I
MEPNGAIALVVVFLLILLGAGLFYAHKNVFNFATQMSASKKSQENDTTETEGA